MRTCMRTSLRLLSHSIITLHFSENSITIMASFMIDSANKIATHSDGAPEAPLTTLLKMTPLLKSSKSYSIGQRVEPLNSNLWSMQFQLNFNTFPTSRAKFSSSLTSNWSLQRMTVEALEEYFHMKVAQGQAKVSMVLEQAEWKVKMQSVEELLMRISVSILP